MTNDDNDFKTMAQAFDSFVEAKFANEPYCHLSDEAKNVLKKSIKGYFYNGALSALFIFEDLLHNQDAVSMKEGYDLLLAEVLHYVNK